MSFFFLYKRPAPSASPSVTLTENPLLVFVAAKANMLARLPEAGMTAAVGVANMVARLPSAEMTAAADAGNWTVRL
jgi:hypothetical protein